MTKIDGNAALAAVTMLQMLNSRRLHTSFDIDHERWWITENFRMCLEIVTGGNQTDADDIDCSVKNIRNILAGMFHLEREDIECYDCEFTDYGWIGFQQNPARNFLSMNDKEQRAVVQALRQKAKSK